MKVQQISLRGTPDLLLCVDGMFVALELKATSDDEADPLQEYNLNKINDCGGIGLTVDPTSSKRVIETIKRLAGGKPR